MRRKILIGLSVLLGLAGVGILSSFTSRTACEEWTVAAMRDLSQGRRLVVPKEDDSPDVREILERAKWKYEVRQLQDLKKEDRHPYGHIRRARVIGPFLVTVDRELTIGRLAGQGSSIRFFCIFGWVVPAWEDVEWFS